MSDVLIKVENLSKKFCLDLKSSLWYGLGDMFMELTGKQGMHGNGLRKKEFWAVNDINFEVKRGECLGLIGRNGAGKSTLLKMLNGLLKPDNGRIEMSGRVGALIELGAGFNPILTGRENIYINGAVLGFTKKEINRKFDAIVDFSEIGEFLDTPVQNYSSGMKVRLGFAVAINMEPDVLLIDEVLAVGDVGFKIKCYNEIFKLSKNTAVIFVSHSMPQIGKVCTQGFVMKEGQKSFASENISEVIAEYYNSFEFEFTTVIGSGRAKILEIVMENKNIKKSFSNYDLGSENYFGIIDTKSEWCLTLNVLVNFDVKKYNCLVSITDVDQKLVAQLIPTEVFFTPESEYQVISMVVNNLTLNTGKYSLSINLIEEGLSDRGEILIGIRSAIKFSVQYPKFIGSAPILHQAKWGLKHV